MNDLWRGQFDPVTLLVPLAAGAPGAGSGVPWFPPEAVAPPASLPCELAAAGLSDPEVGAPGVSAGSGVPELPAAAGVLAGADASG
ncbi:MAG: hypothetical protein WBF85_05760, partial [Mycolicibacter algericus]